MSVHAEEDANNEEDLHNFKRHNNEIDFESIRCGYYEITSDPEREARILVNIEEDVEIKGFSEEIGDLRRNEDDNKDINWRLSSNPSSSTVICPLDSNEIEEFVAKQSCIEEIVNEAMISSMKVDDDIGNKMNEETSNENDNKICDNSTSECSLPSTPSSSSDSKSSSITTNPHYELPPSSGKLEDDESSSSSTSRSSSITTHLHEELSSSSEKLEDNGTSSASSTSKVSSIMTHPHQELPPSSEKVPLEDCAYCFLKSLSTSMMDGFTCLNEVEQFSGGDWSDGSTKNEPNKNGGISLFIYLIIFGLLRIFFNIQKKYLFHLPVIFHSFFFS